MAKPYLHCHHRFKNGKDHRYWSIAEKVKTRRGWVQRHLLYLGEINDGQKANWIKATEVFDPVLRQTQELALYPANRPLPEQAAGYGSAGAVGSIRVAPVPSMGRLLGGMSSVGSTEIGSSGENACPIQGKEPVGCMCCRPQRCIG